MIGRILLGVAAAAVALPASASDTFYEGKTITVVTSTGPGGTYDIIARALSRHMPRHIPGAPTMIVQNMPGGGNVFATNFMYGVAPKDGTAIATITNAMPLHQVFDGQGVPFDASKFNWLGSTGADNETVVAWHTTGIETVEEAMKKEVVVGGTGPGSSIVIFPTVMNNVLGTRFRIVIGYQSSEEVTLAMERGEVEARSQSIGAIASRNRDWIDEKKVRFLAQVGAVRDRRLPDVPLLAELATNEEQRQILNLIASPVALGRPYLAPPEVESDRIALLRDALGAAFRDEALLAEMRKLNIDIAPMSGDEVARIAHDTVNAAPNIIAAAKAAMQLSEQDRRERPVK